ncbi:Y-family DNA polymerase [Fodinibius sediminis]|uniref:DNA polymerase-4 n=1 Tax=Fodinibius sediminis TaxID=1214077 RepID=A0A521DLM2_9BACT|nr:DNA polymerase IV [Fodinibius sediminis]SMO72482.1 DNA polymerase-4 [Fodinibius sediminis]
MPKLPSINPGTYSPDEDVHKITDYRCVSRDMQHTSVKERLYLHLDMNCFYAQVEQQCYKLHGLPIYIGGWYKGEQGIPRGIVATSSYEARALGIKTAMSAYEAEQICPYIIGLQADYEKYKGISSLIEDVLNDFAPTMEKYSMDEYFLDINFLKDHSRAEIQQYGQSLRNLIYQEIGLVCSIGISYSKTYSKLASDLDKPDGLTLVLDQQEAKDLLGPLPLDEVWGIGRKRYEKLQKEGLNTISEGIDRGYPIFQQLFGAYFGKIMYEMISGKDRAKVLTEQLSPKEQLNYMHTFSSQSTDPACISGEIMKGISRLCYRMRGYNLRARQYFCYLRIQHREHKGVSFRFNTEGYTNLDGYIHHECMKGAAPRMKQLLNSGYALRGIGVGTVGVDHSNQQELFFRENPQERQFCLVQDAINNTFGNQTITRASIMDSVQGKTHFLERS